MLPAPAATAPAGALGADTGRANRPHPDASLTDPGPLDGFTDWIEDPRGGRFARSRLRLSGMHCAACAGLIEATLRGRPGVLQAQVNASTQGLVLDWRPEAVSLEDLRQALSGAGYDFSPDLAGPTRALRQREHRQAIWRLFVAGFLMMQVMMLAWPSYVAAPGEMAPDQAALLRWGQWVLTLPVMLLSAAPFFQAAFSQLRARRPGMDVPVSLGLAVAFVAGMGATLDPSGPFGHEVYFDSITMFVAFLLGARYLELRARHRAALALEQAADALPQRVERQDQQGAWAWVAVEALSPGDRVRVSAGQRVPADAVVESGLGAVDESLLTGESRPVDKQPGNAVLAGSMNLGTALTLQVTHVGEQTRLAGIRQLMAQAFQDRPATLRLSERVAGWFLGVVLLLAGGAALAWQFVDPAKAVAVAVSVLIVTCPCALSLAAPAAWVAAAGQLARRGLLLVRLEAIEALVGVDRVVLDKTGTLTDPAPGVRGQWPPTLEPDDRAAAIALAGRSSHPLSRALNAWLGDSASSDDAWSIEEFSGRGLQGTDAQGRCWRLGSPDWACQARVDEERVAVHGPDRLADADHDAEAEAADRLLDPRIVLTLDARLRAMWEIDETLRPGATEAIADWQALGLTVELLSGDLPRRVGDVAALAGIHRWRGGASPEDKLAHVAALQERGHHVLMIGDGINDAPVLARAQVAVAMGQGADLALSRADALLVSERLAVIGDALRVARRTRRVVRQNLAWSALYNATCVPLALIGWLPPWAAGLGMATSSLLVIANAARLGRVSRSC